MQSGTQNVPENLTVCAIYTQQGHLVYHDKIPKNETSWEHTIANTERQVVEAEIKRESIRKNSWFVLSLTVLFRVTIEKCYKRETGECRIRSVKISLQERKESPYINSVNCIDYALVEVNLTEQNLIILFRNNPVGLGCHATKFSPSSLCFENPNNETLSFCQRDFQRMKPPKHCTLHAGKKSLVSEWKRTTLW